MVLDTGNVTNSDIETLLANLLERNEERYKEFQKHCPVICDIPITDIIKTYKLKFLGNVTIKSEKEQLQGTQKKWKVKKSEEQFAEEATFSILIQQQGGKSSIHLN